MNFSEYPTDEFWDLLKRRIDFVPIDLVLAQSANESAWGTSRFVIMGNALFGQQTFSQDFPGIIPYNRRPGTKHSVEKFKSVRQSVRSYINNLNTHPAYLAFRLLRSLARSRGKIPDGQFLAAGLAQYSERREDYIRDIRTMISVNRDLMGLD
jgi:Bax protein